MLFFGNISQSGRVRRFYKTPPFHAVKHEGATKADRSIDNVLLFTSAFRTSITAEISALISVAIRQ
jgi:hypothetical protein